jgi:hypothetical protein
MNLVFLPSSVLLHIAETLSLLDRWSLRWTNKKFFLFFKKEDFKARVRLPPTSGWTADRIWNEVRWFYQLPSFVEDYLQFPFFRQRGAMVRLAGGLLRSVSREFEEGKIYLVGDVVPSQEMTKSYKVRFLFKSNFLVFSSCKCRNGWV